jgi:hypothetical protein
MRIEAEAMTGKFIRHKFIRCWCHSVLCHSVLGWMTGERTIE